MLAALALVAAPAFAQSTPDPAASNTPGASDGVGPQELQNFKLSGSVSEPGAQQAAPAPVPTPSSTALKAEQAAPPLRASTDRVDQNSGQARRTKTRTPTAAPPHPPAFKAVAAPVDAAQSSTPFTPSPAPSPESARAAPALQPSPFPVSTAAPAGVLAPAHKLLIWPWLLVALASAGAGAFLLRRRREQEALAAGPQLDLFVPPEPPPVAVPRVASGPRTVAPPPPVEPATPKPSAPPRTGIVSTRLRPSLEIGVQPLRCLVDDEQLVLEFELELFNSGSAPARAVLAEASLFNAGAEQETELASFFAKPLGAGEPIEAIPPMKRISFTSQVVAPRSALQEYELAGRKVFVPVLAFNALYRWSGGQAQTSAAYLVGRETAGEKLGPLSLESGRRRIDKLAARLLPTALRT